MTCKLFITSMIGVSLITLLSPSYVGESYAMVNDVKISTKKETKNNLNLKLDMNEINRKLSIDFDLNNLRKTSNLNESELEFILENTKMKRLASSFIEAERKYKINALLLCGIVAVESDWGRSDRAIKQNNLTGYAVYSDSSEGTYFDSKHDCILKTAELLSNDYLNVNGKWHIGYSTRDINRVYSSDENWYKKVNLIANELLNKYRENIRR